MANMTKRMGFKRDISFWKAGSWRLGGTSRCTQNDAGCFGDWIPPSAGRKGLSAMLRALVSSCSSWAFSFHRAFKLLSRHLALQEDMRVLSKCTKYIALRWGKHGEHRGIFGILLLSVGRVLVSWASWRFAARNSSLAVPPGNLAVKAW